MRFNRGLSVMGRAALFVALLVAPASRAAAQFCPGCIQNQAALQTGAQFHVSSGSVDGQLTVGTLVLANFSASTATAGVFIGSGTSITNLNATQLLLGTVPSARMTGSYTGITGVGTVAAGTWQGTAIGTQYGGTGANWSGIAAGAIPYFSGTGALSTLTSPSGYGILATIGAGAAPVWVTSPTLTGQHFSAIPLTALTGSTLPANIIVSSNSIPYINAAAVNGNISGGAATLTIALPIGNLAGGTLPTSNAASSVTAMVGLQPGTFGGPTTLAQFRVNYDGRVSTAAQFNLVVYSTQVQPGPLPSGVTIPAAQITSGTLANNVIASSVAASGIGPGTFGGPAQYLALTIGIDGRVSTVTAKNIALPPAQISAGTLPLTVLVPAVNVQAGYLGTSVVASSIANSGVAPGVYGSATVAAQLTITADGRVTSATQFPIPSISTHAAFNNIDNNWSHPQTSQSSWTFLANVAATQFVGDASLLTYPGQTARAIPFLTNDSSTLTFRADKFYFDPGPRNLFVDGSVRAGSATFSNDVGLGGNINMQTGQYIKASGQNLITDNGSQLISISPGNGFIWQNNAGTFNRMTLSDTGSLAASGVTFTSGTFTSGGVQIASGNFLLNGSNGFMGINVTPIDRFEVGGAVHVSSPSASSHAGEQFMDYNNGSMLGRLFVRGGSTSVNPTWSLSTSRSDASNILTIMSADASGNTGFGTLSPACPNGVSPCIDLSGSNVEYSARSTANGGATGYSWTGKTSGAVAQVYEMGMGYLASDGRMEFYDKTQNADRLIITTAGQIYIPGPLTTSSGTFNLTVNGGQANALTLNSSGSGTGTGSAVSFYNSGLRDGVVYSSYSGTAWQLWFGTYQHESTMVLDSGNLSIYGVITSSSVTPTISCNSGSPTMGANSSDNHGSFASGSGATQCTVTFGTGFPKAPDCFCQDDSALNTCRQISSATGSVVFGETNFSADTIRYFCLGAP